MDEEQKALALRAPFVVFDNDAPPMNRSKELAAHPRAFGAFPRILAKYVRQEKVISLEEAIRKLTSLSASILKLSDRGRIAAGLAADLVIFDPERVEDRATFTDPLSHSEGIDVVVVNGQMVVDEGRNTGARPGKPLRHRR
jgi:N-acyl-D-aspartate/D-glutamate deacylase